MKKLMSILIAVSAIASMGFALDANAASTTSSRMTVCARNMSHNGCVIDRSTTVNIPETGKYTVTGNVGRGTHSSSCQAHEDFDLYIDGHFYVANFDDNPCEPGTSDVYRNHKFPEITLSRGSHTIRMIHRLWNKPSTGHAESVSVALIFATKKVPPKPNPINGVCGASNGKTFDTKPASGLCSVGGASSVGGKGPWNWTCAGSNGGKAASCSAQITVAPNCGSSNGKTFDTKPASGLCSVGGASSVGGKGPWNWTCTSGARTASCNADITVAPKCGSSDGGTFSGAPTSGLCSVGNASSVDGSGPWNWTCTSGARTSSCDADYAKTAIQIIKSNKNGGDSQEIESGSDATFTITVKNTGEENLKNVVIADSEARNCGKTASETVAMYDGDLFDPNESFVYTCVDNNVTSAYTNVADVKADATTSDVSVDDKDDSDVTIKTIDPKPKPEPKPEPTPDPEEDEEDEEDDGAIGNFVWHDRNKNGVQDEGEEGIAGVRLKLYNGNDVEKDKTNSRGRYKFKDLDPGQYKVVVAEETLPEGCYQTYDKDGKLDNQIKTRIEGDEYYRKADFGYYCPSTTPVAQTSPQTGPGAVAGTMSFIVAALSAGLVHRRNARENC